MLESSKTKLPQNMQNLLMEIGEKSVLFRLYLLAIDTDWNVFYNLNEIGCDLVLLNMKNNQKIKIEIKTRQKMYSTSNNLNTAQFTVTELEKNSSDFIVCFWYEENAYFIVPSSELKPSLSKGKFLYKFIVRKTKDGVFDEQSTEFMDNWELIKNKLV